IAQAIIGSPAMKIVGGGDTISAIDKIGLLGKFDPSTSSGQVFVSTGGGAMLAFLAGEKLPGLEALEYYK
ncbi:MAG: phosphoglycerate kinase, partial [Rubrivivax sp.]